MDKLPSAEEIRSLADLLWYCKHYEEGIFFRVERNGKWLSLSLAELTAQEWGEKMASVLERGVVPCRVKTEEELAGLEGR